MKKVPKSVLKKLYERANYKCEHCGSKWGLTPHHKKKRSGQGKHILDNLVLLCVFCHDKVERHFWKKGNEWTKKYRISKYKEN